MPDVVVRDSFVALSTVVDGVVEKTLMKSCCGCGCCIDETRRFVILHFLVGGAVYQESTTRMDGDGDHCCYDCCNWCMSLPNHDRPWVPTIRTLVVDVDGAVAVCCCHHHDARIGASYYYY